MFVLKRVLEFLLLPPLAPLLLIIVGLLLMRWRPRLGQGLAWGGVLLSFVLMLPMTVDMLVEPIESAVQALDEQQLKNATEQGAGAIVILGGGIRPIAPEYGRPTLNRITLERVRYGARVARITSLPILVSGGVAGLNYPEAQAMADSLSEDFGMKARWIEDASEDTEQNARYSAVLLKQAGISRIVLVTHAAHMRRAMTYFTAQGLQVDPAPTAFFAPLTDPENALSWRPSANTAYTAWYALHEAAGLLQQRIAK